jgi:hypothetical protein
MHPGLQRTTQDLKEPPREFKEPLRTSKNHPGVQRTTQDFKEPPKSSKNHPEVQKTFI